MNDIEAVHPCIRGCTYPPAHDDQEPKPRPAKHGNLCPSCYYRLRDALERIPDLMANMRLKLAPTGVANYEAERVQEINDEVPAPLNVDVLDASDSLFAKLVSWTEVLSSMLHTPQPSVAVWITLGEAMGSKPVTPMKAHELASQLTAWFLVRLEDITATSVAKDIHDDICHGFNKDNPGVFVLASRYGVERPPMRKSEKRECPSCGKQEVFVKRPDKFNDDTVVMCGVCGWDAEPENYEFYIRLFEEEIA